jgi:hypothetical protein
MTAIPVATTLSARDVLEVAEKEGTLRKAELEKELDYSDRDLDSALVRAVEHGKIALFPVGDSVQIRYEGE